MSKSPPPTPPDPHVIDPQPQGGVFRSLCGQMVYIGLTERIARERNSIARPACALCKNIVRELTREKEWNRRQQ